MASVTESDLARTNITMSYELEPACNIVGDLSGLLGEFCESFVAAFYSPSVSRKVNIVVTELFTNAVAHNGPQDGRIRVMVRLDGHTLSVRVTNPASAEQCDLVKSRVRSLRRVPDPRQVLTETIRERYRKSLKGGLGLIRLVAENRFSLSARSKNGELSVEAKIDLGGLR